MKPVDVMDNTYINFKKEINNKDPKFKVGDHVSISNYKIGQKKYSLLRKLRILCHEHILLVILMAKKLLALFYEKELQSTYQQEYRIERVIKKKGDELYVKWKGYNNSFDSWIDKKDII